MSVRAGEGCQGLGRGGELGTGLQGLCLIHGDVTAFLHHIIDPWGFRVIACVVNSHTMILF